MFKITAKNISAESYWNKLATQSHAAAAIDPADRAGKKNAYITYCRNLAFGGVLKNLPASARVLDFGCGTGTFMGWLMRWRPELSVYGADISIEMLRVALDLDVALDGRITGCDGQKIPFQDNCFELICTAGVLCYVVENYALISLAREFRRALVPGGVVASVEQVRRRTHHQSEHHKIQRSPEEIIDTFAQVGFELLEWRPIRRGRFPLIYLIRYGLIPVRWHDFMARLEARLWRNFGVPQLDYADALFVWRVCK